MLTTTDEVFTLLLQSTVDNDMRVQLPAVSNRHARFYVDDSDEVRSRPWLPACPHFFSASAHRDDKMPVSFDKPSCMRLQIMFAPVVCLSVLMFLLDSGRVFPVR